MLRQRNREVGFAAGKLAEGEQDRIVEVAVELAAAELGFAGRAGDGHRGRAVGHEISLRHTELDAEVGMSEGRALDHALGWVIVDEDAFKLAQELVAIANAGAEAAGRARFGERALHAVFAQRMGARPFGGLTVGPSLHSRFESALPA